VLRRSQAALDPIELVAGRAAAAQPEVAQNLVLDAVEDPGCPRVRGPGRAPVVGTFEQPLGREADSCQRLGRSAVAPPQAAVGAVEGVEILARIRRPGADAALAPADFDNPGRVLVERDPPIKSVAAHVEESATAVAVLGERVQGLGGVVLGMTGGHHRAIARERRRARRGIG
jgi:hypothetical protein